MSYAGEICSLASALVWAVAVVLFRKSGESVPPVALNLFKNAAALVLPVPTLLVAGIELVPAGVPAGVWLRLLLSGVVAIGIADSVQFASLNLLGAGRTAVVDCLYSPLVVLAAALVLAEPIGPALVGGLALMVAAILLESGRPAGGTPAAERRRVRLGVALGVLAMLAMAVGIVLAKPALSGVPVLWATAVRLAGGTAFVAVQGLLPRHRAAVAQAFTPSRMWRVTVPAAVLGNYLAMIVWLVGMKYAPASVAAVLNQTTTLFIPLLAAPMLGERLTARRLGAVGMGFAGAVIVIL
ncbi:MAG: DMT family transporter [Deltaproteobacteria bacterium]|nr:DMT family transporter [Deltaproteobacteria bacterium]